MRLETCRPVLARGGSAVPIRKHRERAIVLVVSFLLSVTAARLALYATGDHTSVATF